MTRTPIYEQHMEIYKAWNELLTSPNGDASNSTMVYTPAPVVAFQHNSCEDSLLEQYGKHLYDEGVECLDPFVGTGMYMVHLILNKKLMPDSHLEAKYLGSNGKHNILCYEIFLPAWYLAIVNIEWAYALRTGEHVAYKQAYLTDTFALPSESTITDLKGNISLRGLFASVNVDDHHKETRAQEHIDGVTIPYLPVDENHPYATSDKADTLLKEGFANFYGALGLGDKAEKLANLLIEYRNNIGNNVKQLKGGIPHHPFLFMPKGGQHEYDDTPYNGDDDSVTCSITYLREKHGDDIAAYEKETKKVHRELKKTIKKTLGGVSSTDISNRYPLVF